MVNATLRIRNISDETLTQIVELIHAESDDVAITVETMRATPPIGSHND